MAQTSRTALKTYCQEGRSSRNCFYDADVILRTLLTVLQTPISQRSVPHTFLKT
jgi:hypothetical protein